MYYTFPFIYCRLKTRASFFNFLISSSVHQCFAGNSLWDSQFICLQQLLIVLVSGLVSAVELIRGRITDSYIGRASASVSCCLFPHIVMVKQSTVAFAICSSTSFSTSLSLDQFISKYLILITYSHIGFSISSLHLFPSFDITRLLYYVAIFLHQILCLYYWIDVTYFIDLLHYLEYELHQLYNKLYFILYYRLDWYSYLLITCFHLI